MSRKGRNSHYHCLTITAVSLLVLVLIPAVAASQVYHRFERMWPTLQQPWYFNMPVDMAIDCDGNIYISDTYNDRVQKFSRDGLYIRAWGGTGYGNGQFQAPSGIAVNRSGYVYVADSIYNQIQKFTSDGIFIKQWGGTGTGNGQFIGASGVAVDEAGNVYVVDIKNNRVQKFTSEGVYIKQWGSFGSGNGQFNQPNGIAVDGSGNVYVTDVANNRVQKFTADGVFIKQWGSYGSGNGQFDRVAGIAVDGNGNVYVTEIGRQGYTSGVGNHRIQKFTADGVFIKQWGSYGTGNGQLRFAEGIGVDGNGNVLVMDRGNSRIQEFTADGVFIGQWGSSGLSKGQFNGPYGIAVDGSGNVYVVDVYNNRIQKFTADGVFIKQWGSFGTGNGQFYTPIAIAVDVRGNVYVTEVGSTFVPGVGSHRIQKFTADGVFIRQWGSYGSGNGQFKDPEGIAVDSGGNVYVADAMNNNIQKFTADGVFIKQWGGAGVGDAGIATDGDGNVYVADRDHNRIQKFTGDGVFIKQWGSLGYGNGQFHGPTGIAVDGNGHVYVTEFYNARIQEFTTDGVFIEVISSFGTNPGQMTRPLMIATGPNALLYVTDYANNRVQAFRGIKQASRNKAIIVAGGGPKAGSILWDATEACANFSYKALANQGFTKEKITYLSSDTKLDLDGNGLADDVTGPVTNDNLKLAITARAQGAEDLILYLVDHGGDETFIMSEKETLLAEDLASWLNTLEDSGTITGKIIIVYDACYSGSFLPVLTSSSGKERIVITSTSQGEEAYFVNTGAISFSYYFWTHVFNGIDVYDSFDLAANAVGYTTTNQHPLLDDNGNGIGNEAGDGALAKASFIGNGIDMFAQAPVIGKASAPQTITGVSSAALYAENITSDDGVGRVWAIIRPPDFNPNPNGSPVLGIPSVDLLPKGTGHYEATYDGFTMGGTYEIAIYASDPNGNTSIPVLTTVSVGSPLTSKAIIVAAGPTTDPQWPATEKNAATAHDALVFQGYSEDDILFMSPMSIPGVDEAPSLQYLKDAIENWAGVNTKDLVIYLVGGNGDKEALPLDAVETLTAKDLNDWLSALQQQFSGKIILIGDSSHSGSFLPRLARPRGKELIVISSTNAEETACFASRGDISFSQYFWYEIANGARLQQAFLRASNGIQYSCGYQTPQLDDNGNGIGNEVSDGSRAGSTTLGVGIMVAASPPVVGSVSSHITLSGGASSAVISAWSVTSASPLERVWVVITPPNYDLISKGDRKGYFPVLELSDVGSGRYQAKYSRFSTPGIYNITIFARDINGKTSLPAQAQVRQSEGPDLVITGVSSPLSAGPGQSILISTTIKNQGTVAAEVSKAGIYLSEDSLIEKGKDILLATPKVGKLSSGASCIVKTRVAIPANTRPGSYTTGAIADMDRSVTESREDNNVRAAGTMIVIE